MLVYFMACTVCVYSLYDEKLIVLKIEVSRDIRDCLPGLMVYDEIGDHLTLLDMSH